MDINYPSQRIRLVILIIYLGLLFLANYLAFEQWLPMSGGKGVWFYTGIASILLANLLVTPFYTKPVDSIAYSVAALIGVYAVNDWGAWNIYEKTTFLIIIVFCLIVLVFSFLTILGKDARNEKTQEMANTIRVLTEEVGNHRYIFSAVIIYALIVFHRSNPNEFLVITASWIVIVVFQPDRKVYSVWQKIKNIWTVTIPSTVLGKVVAYQTPNIVLIQQDTDKYIEFGTPLLIKDPHAPNKIGMVLDYVGRDESLLIRALEREISKDVSEKLGHLFGKTPMSKVMMVDKNLVEQLDGNIQIFSRTEEFVGIIAPDSSIENIYFDVIRNKNVEEGRLVEVAIKGTPVLYQIINGMTKEEVIRRKNKYGYARAKAKKIGVWSDEDKKFEPAKWIPKINEPVYLRTKEEHKPTPNAIGHFPETDYNIEIKSIDELVTHNTAILGILGIGKSMLSIEIVERMMKADIKIIAIDLTNQYAIELSDFLNEKREEEKLKELLSVGSGKDNIQKNVEEGGGVEEFREKINEHLSEFIDDESPYKLKIYNPSSFEIWRQDSKPYRGDASMVSLTPTELTKIISEETLKILQKKGMTDSARVCLVYEEAHSLVPEWNSVVVEGDKEATNGTARAILQGRKYGLGCLLITQRTANVTKTILNQCNTIFAMRTFDDTGKDFLSNYVGSEYADILPALQERQAVFYGKSSSCENPVLIRLNDRPDFTSVFRDDSWPPDLPLEDENEEQEDDNFWENLKDDTDDIDEMDDLPF